MCQIMIFFFFKSYYKLTTTDEKRVMTFLLGIFTYLDDPGLGYKMSSVPFNFARFHHHANSWDYKQHCTYKKQESIESLT